MTYNLDEDRIRMQNAMFPLVKNLATRIDKKDVALIEDFIENYEFPVALEWFYAVVSRLDIVLTDDEWITIKRLAELMEIDLKISR